jgi:hypothetical protein
MMTDRSHYPVRKHRLGDEPPDDDVRNFTASERVAMVEQLTINAWIFKEGRWDGARLHRDVVRTLRGRR